MNNLIEIYFIAAQFFAMLFYWTAVLYFQMDSLAGKRKKHRNQQQGTFLKNICSRVQRKRVGNNESLFLPILIYMFSLFCFIFLGSTFYFFFLVWSVSKPVETQKFWKNLD